MSDGITIIPAPPASDKPLHPHILIYGNPIDGFTYFGPFDSDKAARDYADIGFNDEWWLAALYDPWEFEPELDAAE